MKNYADFYCTIVKWIVDDEDESPTGVIVQVDNGDTQYLTIEEYRDLIKNRIK